VYNIYVTVRRDGGKRALVSGSHAHPTRILSPPVVVVFCFAHRPQLRAISARAHLQYRFRYFGHVYNTTARVSSRVRICNVVMCIYIYIYVGRTLLLRDVETEKTPRKNIEDEKSPTFSRVWTSGVLPRGNNMNTSLGDGQICMIGKNAKAKEKGPPLPDDRWVPWETVLIFYHRTHARAYIISRLFFLAVSPFFASYYIRSRYAVCDPSAIPSLEISTV